MDVKLISVTPKGVRKEFPLVGSVTTLGRQPDCDLQVPLGKISRQHCEVHIEKNKVTLKDLQSVNGTFINGKKIAQQELKPGDVIDLANAIKFMIQINGQPAKIDESKFQCTPTDTNEPAVKKTAPTPAASPMSKFQKPAKPATPFTASQTTKKTEDDDADDILGESFFLDTDDEEE